MILLYGEGDFSFTASLFKAKESVLDNLFSTEYCNISKTNILATSLDSIDDIISKYPHFSDIMFPQNVTVIHDVNALTYSYPTTVSHILWNHPHLGIEDSVQHHQLMCHFFHHHTDTFATIIVSLLSGQFERWKMEMAAAKFGFKLIKRVKLIEADFPGYTCKRNLSGTSFKSRHAEINRDGKEMRSEFFFFSHEKFPLSCHAKEVQVVEPVGSREVFSEPAFACTQCSRMFKSEQGLKTHVRQVHELKKYEGSTDLKKCEECGKYCTGPRGLESHIKSVHKGVKRLRMDDRESQDECYSCGICGSTKSDHVEKFGHNNRSIGKVTCTICQKQFPNWRALDQHTSQVIH